MPALACGVKSVAIRREIKNIDSRQTSSDRTPSVKYSTEDDRSVILSCYTEQRRFWPHEISVEIDPNAQLQSKNMSRPDKSITYHAFFSTFADKAE